MKLQTLVNLLAVQNVRADGRVHIMAPDGHAYGVFEVQTVEFVELDDGTIDVVLTAENPFPKPMISRKHQRGP